MSLGFTEFATTASSLVHNVNTEILQERLHGFDPKTGLNVRRKQR